MRETNNTGTIVSSIYSRSMFRTPVFRPLWLPTAIITLFLLTSIGAMVAMSWRDMHRLQPIHKHLAELKHLQHIRLSLDELLEPILAEDSPIDRDKVKEIEAQFNELEDLNTYMDPDTPKKLAKSLQVLENITEDTKKQLLSSLYIVRAVLAAEYKAHDRLMAGVRNDTEEEFKTATSTFVVLPLLAFAVLFLLRNKIFEPVRELAMLMNLLSRQDYKPAVSSSAGPVLKPLFDNYNHMLSRLAKLEQQNRARHANLENQVRTATHALMEQQRELAATERLAAVGELAAGLAHELRNPLAAMQVATDNLRQEIENPDHAQRLGMVVHELNRVTSLLNALLSQAKQEPERSEEIMISRAVGQLVTLMQYQIGGNIHIQQDIPKDLKCRLPSGRLHQALLNLVLNAAQAMKEKGGNIEISAQSIHDGKFKLSVCDDGQGFPQSMLQGGIRPFFSSRSDGTGLGLGIVQRFARDLGGDISLRNRDPHGAEVSLCLPCEAPYG